MSFSLSNQQQSFGGLPDTIASQAQNGGGGTISLLPFPIFAGINAHFPVAPTLFHSASLFDQGPIGVIDLKGMRQSRVILFVGTASGNGVGPSGSYFTFQYSTDDAIYRDLASGGLTTPLNAAGRVDTGWQNLVAGAKTLVSLDVLAKGDNITSTIVAPVTMMFR